MTLSRTTHGGTFAPSGLTAVLVGKECHLKSGMQSSVFPRATQTFLPALGSLTDNTKFYCTYTTYLHRHLTHSLERQELPSSQFAVFAKKKKERSTFDGAVGLSFTEKKTAKQSLKEITSKCVILEGRTFQKKTD